MKLKSILCAALLALSAPACVLAQSVLTPISQGLVWTPAQWTTAWQRKTDYPFSTPAPLLTWTTGTRPGTPVTGGLGYNTTTQSIEWWTGSAWVSGSGGISGPGTTIKGRTAAWGNTTGTSITDPGSWYNAVAYGADPTGATDTVTAFNAACAAAGAGVVYFPAGIYKFSTSVSAACNIQGDGTNATLFKAASASSGIVNLSGFGNYISDVALIAGVAQTGGYLLTISGTNNVARNLSFQNPWGGITVTGNGTPVLQDVNLGFAPGANMHAAGNGYLINVTSPDGLVYIERAIGVGYVCVGGTGGACTGGTWTTISQAGFNINSAGDVNIANSEMISTGQNMAISPGSGQSVNSIQVQNSKMDNGVGAANNSGIVIAPLGTGVVARGHFIGNWTSDQTSQAFIIDPGASAEVNGIEIIDHQSYGNSSNGILVNSSTAKNIQIIGGSFAGNSLNGVELAAGQGLAVVGGQFSNVGDFGPNAAHDIAIDSGVTAPYSVMSNIVNGSGVLDSAGTGIATCNASSSSTACGSGGGGGGVTNCTTAYGIALYAASGSTVSCLATVYTNSTGDLNAHSLTAKVTSGNGIVLSGTSALVCNGLFCLNGDSSGHLVLGATSGAGGAGILFQNSMLPTVSNSFQIGSSVNTLSNLYTQALNITGVTGSTQCLQANSSGTVSGTGSACGSGGGSGAVSAGTIGQVAVYTGSTTVGSSATPIVTGIGVTSNVNDGSTSCSGAGCVGLSFSGGAAFLGNTTHNTTINSLNGLVPYADGVLNLGGGASSLRWGTLFATTGTINTSDIREKNLVGEERLGLDFIRKLHPVEYEWKDQRNQAMRGTFHGLIAQEVETAIGDEPFAGLARPETPEGRYGLRYTEFVAPLIKAAQQLADEIDQMKAELGRLAAENAALRQAGTGALTTHH